MDNHEASSAMTRIRALVDESSFVEVGALVEARATDFNMAEKKAPSDGVITGYGTINGNLVFVYAQNAAVLGGSLGEMHARKIASLYDMAMKMEAPVLALCDCSGLRLEEAGDALFGMGLLYRKQTRANGVVPQITAVFGTAGGGMAVLSALSDFVFMEKEKGRLFISAPDAVLGNKDDKIAMAESQEKNGIVDFSGTEDEIIAEMKKLVSMLPSSYGDSASMDECTDDLNRSVIGIEGMEAVEAVRQIADNGILVETKRGYSTDVLTGFIKLDGQTVGVVANREQIFKWKGAEQAARHINFCDAFDIPILSLVDVKAYCNCECNEKHMAAASAKLAYAYSNASVPMVTVIRNAVGTAGMTFASKALGADIVYAYPNAQLGVMDARKACEILFADETDNVQAEKAKEYAEKQNSAISAAKRGYVDDIIAPQETRQRVIAALEMLYTKSVYRPDKKHGTI